jgi:hypothetical protein
MKQFALPVLWLTLSAPAGAQLTDQERDKLLDHLRETSKKFHVAVAGLTEAQLNFKAAPERWSVLECAEHIAVSEDMLRMLVRERILKDPPKPEGRQERMANDEPLLKRTVDRSQKAQAPEFLSPKRRFATLAEAVAHFDNSRQVTADYVKQTQDDLRVHTAPHPIFKDLDGYQWLLLLSGHSERHTLQILEVKAAPGFPK